MAAAAATVFSVHLPLSCASACLAHALGSRTEIAGLLVGEVIDHVLHVAAVYTLPRSVAEADRVEVPPEALWAAAQFAEELSVGRASPVRVLGWYHSHPTFTCLPSHVDLRTQEGMQQMDASFVGLIFAVHAGPSTNDTTSRVQVGGFQAVRDRQSLAGDVPRSRAVPVHVTSVSLPLAPSGAYVLCGAVQREATASRVRLGGDAESAASVAAPAASSASVSSSATPDGAGGVSLRVESRVAAFLAERLECTFAPALQQARLRAHNLAALRSAVALAR